MTDPYSVLGITPSADDETIKKAYRKKCKEYHPDLHPDDPSAEEHFKEVQAAYSEIMRIKQGGGASYSAGGQRYGSSQSGYSQQYQDPFSGAGFGFGPFGFGYYSTSGSSGRQSYGSAAGDPELRAAANYIRCFGDIGKLRADGAGRKTKPEGQVLRVDAQVSHTAVFSVGCTHALPVDGFCQIHVGGMLDGEACLDDLPECALAVPFYHLLYGGIEWEFAGAPHKYLGATGHGGLHLLAGRKVHAERFFPDEVFPRADDVAVHLCVQVVGHRAVYGLHLGIGQQLVIIAVKVLCVRHLAEPVEIFWREVARSNNDGAGQLACQMQPAHGDAGEFAAHQAAADHTEAHGFYIHRAAPFCAAVSASALSNRATSLPAIVSVVMSGSFVRATGGQLGL